MDDGVCCGRVGWVMGLLQTFGLCPWWARVVQPGWCLQARVRENAGSSVQNQFLKSRTKFHFRRTSKFGP